MKYERISYEDHQRKGYSSGVEIEGVRRSCSKIEEAPEYWFVDKDGAVRYIEEKNVGMLVLVWFETAEMEGYYGLPEYRKMALWVDGAYGCS